jgi:hypothetical protein
MIGGAFLLDVISTMGQQWLLGDIPLLAVRRIVWTLLAVTFVITLIIEWPFYYFAMRHLRRRWSSVLSVGIANVGSYILLLLFYVWISRNTLSDFQLQAGLGSIRLPEYSVLYISPADGDVYLLRLDGSAPQHLFTLGERSEQASLELKMDAEADRANLVVQVEHAESIIAPMDVIRGSRQIEPDVRRAWADEDIDDFRPPEMRTWKFRTSVWAYWAFSAFKGDRASSLDVALDLPILSWPASLVAAVPGEYAIFEFGPQIVLFDPSKRTLHFLVLGQGPLVLKDAPGCVTL